MTEPPFSPLQLIHQQELELRRRVDEAHEQAEAQIQAARQEAKKMIAQADREGRIEAEAIFQRGIDQAQQQAEEIVSAAQSEAATLRDQTLVRLDEVAPRIVALVLPDESTGGD